MNEQKTIDNLANRRKGLVITVGNYKGGAGKTSNSILIAYQLSKLGVKTLVIDLDPQTNATKALLLTKSANDPDNINTVDKTIMYGVSNQSFRDLPVKIINNLYLLPSFTDFQDFPKYVYQHTNRSYDEALILKPLIDPLKDTFDIILLDVPPMSKEVTENAVVASDYTLISFQTQERSLTGAENYISDLLKYKDTYSLDIDILGILPVLQNKNGSVDTAMLEAAKDAFGDDLVFKTVIPHMERIKRFDITGITDRDRFDKKVMEKYKLVASEFAQRVYESENS
ncbi:ParA family protein [Levilactobacillus brevis]|uniref:ParA family protein n=1 Tax=Levilactobacillus brevis TaxID=1580 RepID=A0AA41JUA5_LEVBR|nr:ParA family protein [Levilactobacillus brevis]MBS0948734.1 ParA family protein [Levilactobacillus brevis]MBS1011870.1 ParA family protein [Levilactobacillus brevis]QCZ44861.1 replication-associated protein [Levilactobacillus brevis]